MKSAFEKFKTEPDAVCFVRYCQNGFSVTCVPFHITTFEYVMKRTFSNSRSSSGTPYLNPWSHWNTNYFVPNFFHRNLMST